MTKFYVQSRDLNVLLLAKNPLGAAVEAVRYNLNRKPGVLCTGDHFFVDERGFRSADYASHHINAEHVYDMIDD